MLGQHLDQIEVRFSELTEAAQDGAAVQQLLVEVARDLLQSAEDGYAAGSHRSVMQERVAAQTTHQPHGSDYRSEQTMSLLGEQLWGCMRSHMTLPLVAWVLPALRACRTVQAERAALMALVEAAGSRQVAVSSCTAEVVTATAEGAATAPAVPVSGARGSAAASSVAAAEEEEEADDATTEEEEEEAAALRQRDAATVEALARLSARERSKLTELLHALPMDLQQSTSKAQQRAAVAARRQQQEICAVCAWQLRALAEGMLPGVLPQRVLLVADLASQFDAL